jgi:HNH endonuclease
VTVPNPITTIRVDNQEIVAKPGFRVLDHQGRDWSWAYVIFREIRGFTGYWIGSEGSLWSFRDNSGRAKERCKPIRPAVMDSGHLKKHLTDDWGHRRNCYIHRLVLEAFIGPPSRESLECRHLDGRPSNNNVVNLAWGTRRENIRDRDVIHRTTARGGSYPHVHLHPEDIVTMYDLCEDGMLVKDIAAEFQIDPSEASKILKGVYWSHAVPGRTPPLKDNDGRARAWASGNHARSFK